MKHKTKIYLANGLFGVADRMFNDVIYSKLVKAGYEVYAPQKNLSINNKKASAGSIPIYEGDTAKLRWCDVLVAVLDGQDLGVATEIGYLASYNEYHKDKKVLIGIYTDCRDASKTMSEAKNKDMKKGIAESQYSYINLYTIGAIKKYGVVVDTLEKAISYLKKIKL